jgi:hypothetical protein
VNNDIESYGLTIDQLWAAAWVLGLGALGTILRLATYAADGVRVQAELFVWVLVGIVAAVFSACSAVLAGIKSAERRLSQGSGVPMA